MDSVISWQTVQRRLFDDQKNDQYSGMSQGERYEKNTTCFAFFSTLHLNKVPSHSNGRNDRRYSLH